MNEYGCVFCLSIVESDVGPPEVCVACHVSRCLCGTFIKGDSPKFCFGCGKVGPDAKAHFMRTSSTGAVYATDEWVKRNLGRRSEGPFYTSTSILGGGVRRQLVKRDGDNTVVIRDFSAEEIAKLYG